jgi:hypothetical protein
VLFGDLFSNVEVMKIPVVVIFWGDVVIDLGVVVIPLKMYSYISFFTRASHINLSYLPVTLNSIF